MKYAWLLKFQAERYLSKMFGFMSYNRFWSNPQNCKVWNWWAETHFTTTCLTACGCSVLLHIWLRDLCRCVISFLILSYSLELGICIIQFLLLFWFLFYLHLLLISTYIGVIPLCCIWCCLLSLGIIYYWILHVLDSLIKLNIGCIG